MALYKDLVFKHLMVSKKFLENHSNVIREKLEHAAKGFQAEHGNIFAINMCLHAASSVILSHPGQLKETLEYIRHRDGLKKRDATTILTICMLYYLLDWDADRAALGKTKTKTKTDEKPSAYKELHKGFDNINWLVGDEAMRVLGLKRA